jgi:hypothetical protein
MKNSRAGKFHSSKRISKKSNNFFKELVTNIRKKYPNAVEISIIQEFGVFRIVKFKRDENADFETLRLFV